MAGFEWEKHKTELDRIFFKDFSLVPRGSKDHSNFWEFFRRYQQFKSEHAARSEPRSEEGKEPKRSRRDAPRSEEGREPQRSRRDAHSDPHSVEGREPQRSRRDAHQKKEPEEDVSPKFGLPKSYDRSYRIGLSVMPPDLAYKLRGVQEKRREEGRTESPLSDEHLTQFRTALRHFINFQQKQKFDKLCKIRRDQAALPIHQYQPHVVNMVRSHQVVLIAGDTGCGKSTQVPRYLMEAGYHKIACTQPRRIACISLAKRVGYEMLNEYGSEIAYQVRFERSKTMVTKILFLTEGLLLRQFSSDSDLSWYDVIIVDEVHERHIHGDFLLGILKGLVDRRADLKLVLMSATINVQLFSSYFNDAPVIRVPGRLYPIDLDYHPIASMLGPGQGSGRAERLNPKPYLKIMQKIDQNYPSTERGDLLIFLSGINEIMTLMEEAKSYATQTQAWVVLPLHSALSIEEQDRVFDVAPDGIRKCIISTNIAETSVTIDGVRFVVDSGKVKEMSFDSTSKMRRLQEFWLSRASAEQRKGRAGRTGPGVCFRMYAESDYDAFSEYSTPEIQRVPLDALVLQITALGLGDVRKFPFLELPSMSNIETSISFLKEQGALLPSEELSPIGRMLAQLPVDIVVGKMLIMATIFHVVEPVLVMAAALSVQSPFSRVTMGQSNINMARRPLESEHGDPFTLLNAYDEWIEVKAEGGGSTHRWCKARGIEQQRFYEITKLKEQFQEILQEHGLLFRGFSEGRRAGGSSRDRLTEEQKRELRQMRKRQKADHRKRKLIKLDEDGGAESDGEEDSTHGLKDLEFKLLHNLSKLQEASSIRRNFTLRDINVLKIVLCSGLYPQLAIADDCNSYRRDSSQVFHTRSKGFVVLHPTSIFSTNPEYLQPQEKKTGHELMAYVDLLETNKPYLVNVLRTPGLQTVTLFSQNLDTNVDCTRLVVDGWVEVKLQSSEVGQQVLAALQTLRNTWTHLLELKLEASKRHYSSGDNYYSAAAEDDDDNSAKISALESLLANKLAEYLDSTFSYSLTKLPNTAQAHLYRGPSKTTEADGASECSSSQSSSPSKKPHPTKGGWCITEYLTYDCLLEELDASAVASKATYMSRVWTCPVCESRLAVNMAEQLQHQASCTKEVDDALSMRAAPSSSQDPALLKDYHCTQCGQTLQTTAINILRHKRDHVMESKPAA